MFFCAGGQFVILVCIKILSVEHLKSRFFRAGGLLVVWLVPSNMCINVCIIKKLVYSTFAV
jgi:hypothetical protein